MGFLASYEINGFSFVEMKSPTSWLVKVRRWVRIFMCRLFDFWRVIKALPRLFSCQEIMGFHFWNLKFIHICQRLVQACSASERRQTELLFWLESLSTQYFDWKACPPSKITSCVLSFTLPPIIEALGTKTLRWIWKFTKIKERILVGLEEFVSVMSSVIWWCDHWCNSSPRAGN